MIHMLWAVLGVALVLISAPGTLELLLFTCGGMLPPRRRGPAAHRKPQGLRLAAVIPAHNEEVHIARCVESLRLAAGEADAIVVIADNCSDQTAERARAAGARVLERQDAERRGKGYALEYGFSRLLAEGFDVLAVIDADTVVEPNFLSEVRRLCADGADAVQARYGVLNPEAGMRTRLMNIALLAYNTLRPRARDRWGLSAGILGNGFALTRETLCAVPYDAHSVVEDVEYHLRLVRAGRAVRFADRTTVRADMPTTGPGVETQRARWEGGRLRMLVEQGPALAADVLGGRVRLLEPLLDLLLLPLAFHVLLLGATLAIPFAPAQWYAAGGLALAGVHVLAAIVVGGGGWRDIAALAAVPFYIVWKVAIARVIARASRPDTTWVRTDRTAR